MSEPFSFFLILVLVATFGYLLLRPQQGYVWRWQHMRRRAGRVLIEDALKHLYDCEYLQRTATVQSLSGTLGISGDEGADLLARIEARKLLQSREGVVRLTPEGREYALRIIRAHRLWERYLSDETGLSEAEWHKEAERREHAISAAEADALAAQMGNPSYDPHGDPIPTSSGDLPPRRGRPLTALPVGQLATIVHLEDEPQAVYAQLVAESLHPGTQVQVTEVSPERICFWGNGDEHVLAPVVAANISVVSLPVDQVRPGPFETLAALQPGQKAMVVSISASCRGLERRRLMDLGVLPGTLIEAEMKSPAGDPTAYRIRGALIALRQKQANLIHISRLKQEAA